MESKGYYYVAYGKNFYKEAEKSITSLRKVDPLANITLVSKRESPVLRGIVDTLIVREDLPTRGHSGRVECLVDLIPYDRTFFVDTDTVFFENCRHLFDYLDYFDFLAVPEPGDREILPGVVPPNLGVSVYKKNEKVKNLFAKGKEYFLSGKGWKRDASSLQEALKVEEDWLRSNGTKGFQPYWMRAYLESDIRLLLLHESYNVRTRDWMRLRGNVKILHGRSTKMDELADRMNALAPGTRVWNPVEEVGMRSYHRYVISGPPARRVRPGVREWKR